MLYEVITPLGHTVDENQVDHLLALVKLDGSFLDLASQGLVGTDQKLLAGLATGEEGTGDLGAAERAVVEVSGVIATEGNALGDTLVDDVVRHLGQTPDVGFAGAEVAALDGIVEQTINGVTVIRIVFSRVDPALSYNFV